MVFRGTFEYRIDDRGRIPVPARYRGTFANGAILTEGEDGCVEVYTVEAYEKQAELLLASPSTRQKGRRLRRGFFGRSLDVDLDGQGRILLPPRMRQEFDLNGTVFIVGRAECLEIWSEKRWGPERTAVAREYRGNLESLEKRP